MHHCWGSCHVLTIDMLGQVSCVLGDAFCMVGYLVAFVHNQYMPIVPQSPKIYVKERESEKERVRLKQR